MQRTAVWPLLTVVASLQIACADRPVLHPAVQAVAVLESAALDEVSGIAQSRNDADVLWAINDDGPPLLYALAKSGELLGIVRIIDAVNRDWEDLAGVSIDGRHYLLIADIGDNEGRRDSVTIYVIEEPATEQGSAEIAWRIDFRYPAGSRDAESLAVDPLREELIVLSKRDIPARSYRLPLQPPDRGSLQAVPTGELLSLPQPSVADRRRAPLALDWYWQPTALAISRDNRQAAVLTYRAVYHYQRQGDDSWLDALARAPAEYRLGPYDGAEALTFDSSGSALWITTEKTHAPLLRLDLGGIEQP